MKKLISWCAGLRVRLREMVGGTVADFNSRVAGGGHGWQEEEKGEKGGGVRVVWNRGW